MVTAKDVFTAAMALMDELSAEGEAVHEDTGEYARRTPGILNALAAELRILTGERAPVPLETLEDALLGVEDSYGLGVLHYGLAAHLLVDENPAAAAFYEQRYEELRDRFLSRRTAQAGLTEDVYGGVEHGQFGSW